MALIPPDYLNAVVSLEIPGKGKTDKDNKTIATGFLYGEQIKRIQEKKITFYQIFLATNRHVFEDKGGNLLEKVLLRFNLSEKRGTKCYQIDLVDKDKKPKWTKHKDDKVDLAIIHLNANAIKNEGIECYFFRSDTDVLFTKDFEEKGISTGDGIFILGFPLGLRGKSRNYAIVKSGIISRTDDEVLKNKYFLIDSSAYPGSSGGPVIYKPEVISIHGTKALNRSGLIGIVSSGITYQETATSIQTGQPRIIFEEQTGLVKVVPIDLINQAIKQYIKSKGKPKESENVKEKQKTNKKQNNS